MSQVAPKQIEINVKYRNVVALLFVLLAFASVKIGMKIGEQQTIKKQKERIGHIFSTSVLKNNELTATTMEWIVEGEGSIDEIVTNSSETHTLQNADLADSEELPALKASVKVIQ